MNYYKLLILGLTATLVTQNSFAMQKQSTFLDFKTQALNWTNENKTPLLYGACALITGYCLYKYWSAPKTPEQIKAKIKKNTASYIQNLADMYGHSTIQIIDQPKTDGTYTLTIKEHQDTQGKTIGMKARYKFACDNTTEEIIFFGNK